MIIGAVLTVLNSVIANPSLIESDGEVSTYSPTANIIRQQNEINQMSDSIQVDFDRVKSEIFKLAEMKYDCCIYNDSPQKTKEIKSLLENHSKYHQLRVAAYCRVSTEQEEQQNSYQVQIAYYTDLINCKKA